MVQRYITNPLLVNRRKFDLRVFGMLTSFNGKLKGYFYEDGYLRTSSREFSLQNINSRIIHLTNDAIQKRAEDYGKFENGNKLSLQDFQKFLDSLKKGIRVDEDIMPQIRHLVAEAFRAVAVGKIDSRRRQHSFEIFGFDFMVDDEFHIYLIEANTNPCLETPCPLLSRIIPSMLDSAFRIAVDPFFPPPDGNSKRQGEAL